MGGLDFLQHELWQRYGEQSPARHGVGLRHANEDVKLADDFWRQELFTHLNGFAACVVFARHSCIGGNLVAVAFVATLQDLPTIPLRG